MVSLSNHERATKSLCSLNSATLDRSYIDTSRSGRLRSGRSRTQRLVPWCRQLVAHASALDELVPDPPAISAAQIITPESACSSHTISLRVVSHSAASG